MRVRVHGLDAQTAGRRQKSFTSKGSMAKAVILWDRYNEQKRNRERLQSGGGNNGDYFDYSLLLRSPLLAG
jgi:hypothetical protein